MTEFEQRPADIAESYTSAELVLGLMTFFGWFMFVGGILFAAIGLISVNRGNEGLAVLGVSFAISFSGLMNIGLSRIGDATLDSARNSKKILQLLELQAATADENTYDR